MPSLFVPPRGIKSEHRVCAACDKESASFKAALIAGEVQQALLIFQNGNINLRSSFPFDKLTREKPIHIAAASGSIPLVKWLIMDLLVPASNIVTFDGKNTVMGYAAKNLDVDMLAWLVRTGACQVKEVKDAAVLAEALHATLQLHTLDPDTERYVSSLEVASAEAAGDAGLGVRVQPGMSASSASSSTTTPMPAVATHVTFDQQMTGVAEAQVSISDWQPPQQAEVSVMPAVPPAVARARAGTAERSMDL